MSMYYAVFNSPLGAQADVDRTDEFERSKTPGSDVEEFESRMSMPGPM